jgi:hypothetical protein
MRTTLIALTIVLAATPASAQLNPPQAQAIADKSIVTVTVLDGTWKGRLIDITPEFVTIQPPREATVRLPLADVLRVDTRKPDPIGNGALIGAAAGVLYCIALCRNGAWMLMEGSVGMVIGSVVDARTHATISLYKRPERDVPKRSSGLFVTVRF